MKKILILGVGGMAGHMVYNVLHKTSRYQVIGTARNDNVKGVDYVLDVTDEEKLNQVINSIKPDYIINCIGILVDESKKYPVKAIYANAYLPHILKGICDKIDCRLIHLSTDCVFSGRDGKYKESDLLDANDVYGRTKVLGEITDSTNHTTIRTSIIGPELNPNGSGLFNWFFRQKKSVRGFVNAFWSGVTTLELANFIMFIIDNNYKSSLIHLTNSEPISKYNLLSEIIDVFSIDIKLLPDKKKNIDKSFICTDKNLTYSIPSYHDMLVSLRDYMYGLNMEYIHKVK